LNKRSFNLKIEPIHLGWLAHLKPVNTIEEKLMVSRSYGCVCSVLNIGIPDTYRYAKPSGADCGLTGDFLSYNSMPGQFTINNFDATIVFPEHLPAKACEDVYTTVWYWKPLGVALLTNRQDLFVKERLILNEVSALQSKKRKHENKLRKISSKLEELIDSLGV
jgi:hypothetical protein